MICASPDLDASPSFINNELLFLASLALFLGFLFGLDLCHLLVQLLPTQPPPSVFGSYKQSMCMRYVPGIYIYSRDHYCTPVCSLNDLISIFWHFVAQMWPYLPPHHALHLAAIPPQKEILRLI